MADRIMLDSGPLGAIAHPRANPGIVEWLRNKLAADAELFIPEIADYEVRRELIRQKLHKSIQRLNHLQGTLSYCPLDSAIMLRAAELWAEARNLGKPTADPKELDGDVILAAQAERIGAAVATENMGHLSLFVEARHWSEL